MPVLVAPDKQGKILVDRSQQCSLGG